MTTGSINKTYTHKTAYLSNNQNNTQNSIVLTLPFSPNDLQWSYTLNKVSYDTYAGRVTQLLSVKIDQMSLQADAGSRQNLMNIYAAVKQLQDDQIKNRLPLVLTVPADSTIKFSTIVNGQLKSQSTPITLSLWFNDMQIGFDPTTVTYPYIMDFNVADDSYPGNNSYSSLSKIITNAEIKSLFAKSPGSNEIDFGTTSSMTYAGLQNLTSSQAAVKKKTTGNATVKQLSQDFPDLGNDGGLIQ
jgi:hypothetical protein